MSVVLIEIGIFAGIIIGIVQICLMITRKKKPETNTDEKL